MTQMPYISFDTALARSILCESSQLRQPHEGKIRDYNEKGVVQNHKSYAVHPKMLQVSPSTP